MPPQLPGLPCEVRALVADGVYSLYELKASKPSEPCYVLLTSRPTEYYLLSSRGDLMSSQDSPMSIAELPLGAPVMLSGEGGTVRVNFA